MSDSWTDWELEMQDRYWKNVTTTGVWNHNDNWFSDAAATTPASVPLSGDFNCYPATGETGTVLLNYTVNIGAGTCTIPTQTASSAVVNGGTFSADGFNNASGTLYDCKITGANFVNAASQSCYGSVVTGAGATNNGFWRGGAMLSPNFTNAGTIFGGILVCATSIANSGTIHSGWFSTPSFTNTGTVNTGAIWITAGGRLQINGTWYTAAGSKPASFTTLGAFATDNAITTQAADAATLEAQKAKLLAPTNIAFGASSVTGTLPVARVMAANGGNILTTDVRSDTATGLAAGGTIDLTNMVAGNIRNGVIVGGVTGTAVTNNSTVWKIGA